MATDPNPRRFGMYRIENTGGAVQVAFKEDQAIGPERRILAEGDSWFDKFTPLPVGSNLLSAIKTPFVVALHDLSHVGDEADEMAHGWQARQTRALLGFPSFEFDAILLSAGGNDLKNVFASVFRSVADGQISVGDALTPACYDAQLQPIMQSIRQLIALRDNAASSKNRSCPVLLHGYDYFQPRPCGARVFAGTRLGPGPWLYPAMKQAGLNDGQMAAAARAVVDSLNEALKRIDSPNVHVVDTRGTLSLAPAGSTVPSADWEDEIHPSSDGFAKLARRWEDVLIPLL